MYLLDSNVVIGLLKGNTRLLAILERHDPEQVGISTVVAHELYFGAAKSARSVMNMATLDRLPLTMLEFTQKDARQAGEIRAALASAGTPIGPYDVLIAGQAVARGLILVTRNIGEFSRVDGLAIENWEA